MKRSADSVAAGDRQDRPERRGEQRPAVLAPARSRLGDWTIWALFRLGDAAAIIAVAVVYLVVRTGPQPKGAAAAVILEAALLIWSLHAVDLYGLGADPALAGGG